MREAFNPNEMRLYNGGASAVSIPMGNGSYLTLAPGAQLDLNWSWQTQWPSDIMVDYNKTAANSPETALVNSYCTAHGGTVTNASTSGGSTPSCELPNGSLSTLQVQSAMGMP